MNIKMNNDEFGDYCQEIVLNYFREHYQTFAKSKGTNGHDLILYYNNKELKIEVKGISNLFKKIHTNFFTIDTDHLKYDTTHFAFIIQDEILIREPILFLSTANTIFNYIKHKSTAKSHYHRIPIRWIKNNLTPIYLTLKEGKKEGKIDSGESELPIPYFM